MSESLNALDKIEIEAAERVIQEFQEAEQAGEVEEVRKRYAISGVSTLNWAFRKITALNKKKAELDSLLKEETARLKEWHDKATKDVTRDTEFFNLLITSYAEERRAADPKFKKETTPYGEVAFKKQAPEWIFTDESAVVKFCREHELESLVKVVTVEKVEDKTQFKKAFDVKTNVIARIEDLLNEEGEVIVRAGEVLDTVDEDGVGTLYTLHFHSEEEGGGMSIIDNESGEFTRDVIYYETAVVERISELVVPGVKAEHRLDKIETKPAK